jgi:hypothetical protein
LCVCLGAVAALTIWEFNLLYLVRHHIHHNTERQESNTENDENSAGGDVAGDGAPGRERLLLKLGLLECVDSFLNAEFLLVCLLHSKIIKQIISNDAYSFRKESRLYLASSHLQRKEQASTQLEPATRLGFVLFLNHVVDVEDGRGVRGVVLLCLPLLHVELCCL